MSAPQTLAPVVSPDGNGGFVPEVVVAGSGTPTIERGIMQPVIYPADDVPGGFRPGVVLRNPDGSLFTGGGSSAAGGGTAVLPIAGGTAQPNKAYYWTDWGTTIYLPSAPVNGDWVIFYDSYTFGSHNYIGNGNNITDGSTTASAYVVKSAVPQKITFVFKDGIWSVHVFLGSTIKVQPNGDVALFRGGVNSMLLQADAVAIQGAQGIAFGLPSMSTTQRLALTPGARALKVYDTTLNQEFYWDVGAAVWRSVASAASAAAALATVVPIAGPYTLTDANQGQILEVTGAQNLTVGALTSAFQGCRIIQVNAASSPLAGTYTGDYGQTATAAVAGSEYALVRTSNGSVYFHIGA